MAQEKQELTRINWTSCFDFVHIFRSFKMALDPSMLFLALMGVVISFAAGKVLGAVAAALGGMPEIGTGESVFLIISTILIAVAGAVFIQQSDNLLRGLLLLGVAAIVGLFTVLCWVGPRPGGYAVDVYVPSQLAGLDADGWARLARQARQNPTTVLDKQADPFQSFSAFVADQFDGLAGSLWRLNNPLNGFGTNPIEPAGALYYLCGLILGVVWLFIQHPMFAVIYGIILLMVWAITGGAIARIAALKATRAEKITIREAVEFAGSKFSGFFCAPLMPVICVLLIGTVLAAGAFLAMVPYIGDVIGGLLFGLAVAAGFVMALLVIGGAGGCFLMYPTVAVEASDSFDATSRSFAYFYQKPWRTVLYTLVAGVYGVLCYLFLRTVVWLALKLAHAALSVGSFCYADRIGADGKPADMINALWPAPTFSNLLPGYDVLGETRHLELFTAFFVILCVSVVVCLLAAYLVSYFFSASTLIYLLLRYHTDATDLEEVTVDEEIEEVPSFESPAAAEQPAGPPPQPEPAGAEVKPEPGNASSGGEAQTKLPPVI